MVNGIRGSVRLRDDTRLARCYNPPGIDEQ
jgi:hypothetical protein